MGSKLLGRIVHAFLLLMLALDVQSQEVPDFSGLWFLDEERSTPRGIYGQARLVRQSASELNMTVFGYAEYSSMFNVIPWKFRFGRWGPRRGGEESNAPPVQVRWDGEKLLMVKSPGEHYSVLWVWTLLPEGNAMLVETYNWSSLPTSFDFRLDSIPSGYVPHRHVYMRRTSLDGCNGCTFSLDREEASPNRESFAAKLGFTLYPESLQLDVTCLAMECAFVDIMPGGSRGNRRVNGESIHLSIERQTRVDINDR